MKVKNKIKFRHSIKTWKKIAEPVAIWDFLNIKLSEAQKNSIHFAPKIEMVKFQNPHSKKPYEGWRTNGGNWATVFALLPDNTIPVTIEFKHGIEEILISLPAGVVQEGEDTKKALRRELLEETGVVARRIVALGDPKLGIAPSSRKATTRYFGFLALDAKLHSPQQPDDDEIIQVVFVKIPTWLAMIERGLIRDASAITTTYLALRKLKKLSLLK